MLDPTNLLEIAAFIIVYSFGAVVLFPSPLLTFAGGYLFGAYLGTFVNLLGATVGAVLCFTVAAKFQSAAVLGKLKTLMDTKLPHFKTSMPGFYRVFLLRVIPFIPYSAVNYGFGLTRVNVSAFTLATLLGLAPKIAIGTFLGSMGRYFEFSDINLIFDRKIIIPLLVYGLLLLVSRPVLRNLEQTKIEN